MKYEHGVVIDRRIKSGEAEILQGQLDISITGYYELLEAIFGSPEDDEEQTIERLLQRAPSLARALILKLTEPEVESKNDYELWVLIPPKAE